MALLHAIPTSQSASSTQEKHRCVKMLQWGVFPPQSAADRHSTQWLFAVSHCGTGEGQSEAVVQVGMVTISAVSAVSAGESSGSATSGIDASSTIAGASKLSPAMG